MKKINVLPHSVEAEQAVLGGIMLDPKAFDKIEDKISEQDFYLKQHQLLFKAMLTLAKDNQPFDVVTMCDVLNKQSILNNGVSEIYLFELARNTPSAANIEAYAKIVRERAISRELLAAINEISSLVLDVENGSIEEILNEAESKIFKITQRTSRGSAPTQINTYLSKAAERLDSLSQSQEKSMLGTPSGFTALDEVILGLQKGDFFIIAGRPSMGKTAFALNVVENVTVQKQKPVLIFSMEMSGEQLALRLLSSFTDVDHNKFRSGNLTDQEWRVISEAISQLSQLPLFIDDTPSLTPSELRARARRLAREQGGLELIVVDYLQLMHIVGSKENQTAEISEISRSLKSLARELNIPVIALSQLNRSLEQRTDKRPIMADIRQSGGIEQDADVITFIYRDEVYNANTPDKGLAEIIIAKHRNGAIGKVRMGFDGKHTRFINFAEYRQRFLHS